MSLLFLKAFALFIGLTLLGSLCSKQMAEPEIHLIPAGYMGNVYIFHNVGTVMVKTRYFLVSVCSLVLAQSARPQNLDDFTRKYGPPYDNGALQGETRCFNEGLLERW